MTDTTTLPAADIGDAVELRDELRAVAFEGERLESAVADLQRGVEQAINKFEALARDLAALDDDND